MTEEEHIRRCADLDELCYYRWKAQWKTIWEMDRYDWVRFFIGVLLGSVVTWTLNC